MSTYSRLLAII